MNTNAKYVIKFTRVIPQLVTMFAKSISQKKHKIRPKKRPKKRYKKKPKKRYKKRHKKRHKVKFKKK